MAILIYIALLFITYVATFKSDFSDEHLNKVVPFMISLSLIVMILSIFS